MWLQVQAAIACFVVMGEFRLAKLVYLTRVYKMLLELHYYRSTFYYSY